MDPAADIYIQKSAAVISPFGVSASGVTSSPSCLVEDTEVCFPCFCSVMMCLKQPLITSLSSYVGKALRFLALMSLKLYQDQTARLCIRYLSLFTDVSDGQEDKMELINFPQIYHSSDGYSTSV